MVWNFADTEDFMIHMQAVEGMAMRAKRKNGNNWSIYYIYYNHEFVFRNKHKHHILT